MNRGNVWKNVFAVLIQKMCRELMLIPYSNLLSWLAFMEMKWNTCLLGCLVCRMCFVETLQAHSWDLSSKASLFTWQYEIPKPNLIDFHQGMDPFARCAVVVQNVTFSWVVACVFLSSSRLFLAINYYNPWHELSFPLLFFWLVACKRTSLHQIWNWRNPGNNWQ